MSKRGKRRTRLKQMESFARIPTPSTDIIDPKYARTLPLVFGFKNLDLDRDPFKCSERNGEGFLYVLKSLTLFSQLDTQQIDLSYKNCHLVSSRDITKHKLVHLLQKAPSKRLHQLGRKRTPERIIGYYDNPALNLFQICLFDLKHALSK